MGSLYSKKQQNSNMATDTTIGIVKEEVKLPREQDQGKLAFVLHNVYTPQECEELIRASEKVGYIPAIVNTGIDTGVYLPDYRKSDRCLIDNKDYAKDMMKRIRTYLPATFKGHRLVEINERFRFLRYNPGDFFLPHMDGSYSRPETGDKTRLTIQLYLNQGFNGGATTFLRGFDRDPRYDVPVIPRTGSILVFQHDLYHEGSKLIDGRKYTIRTDVLYTLE